MRTLLMMIVSTALITTGCATWDGMTDTAKGTMIGVLGGAAAGAAIGHNHRGRGALIGAVGGGLAGAGVGYYMDSQAKDLQKALASEVKDGHIRIVKNANNTIGVTMTANTAFDTNSTTVQPRFFPTLDKIAHLVNKYGKTTLTITGHTDNTGSATINQPLSEQRAMAVASYLLAKKVMPARMSAHGRGANNPVVSNATEAGRTLNRRVEILIEPIVE